MTARWPDLQLLELVVEVAESGSISAAARTVGITQPSATASLGRLERHLGLRLVDRSTRGSVMTADGALVVDWAREVLGAAERMEAATAALRSARSAALRIAASMTVAEYLVPGWLRRYRLAHPNVVVHLVVLNSDHVLRDMSDGLHDVGFVETTQRLRKLRSVRLMEDELVVVAARGHPWTKRRHPVDAAELARTPLVHRELGSGTRQAFMDSCRRAGLTPVDPAVSLSNNTAVRVAALAGTAPAVVSRLAVKDATASGDLVVIPISDLPIRRPIRAVWHGPRAPIGAAADFIVVARSGPR